MKIKNTDFEFFTFIMGAYQKEFHALKGLIESFPYKNSKKLNIIDKSHALIDLIKDKEKKIYFTDRYYLINPKIDFRRNDLLNLIEENKQFVNLIQSEKFDLHTESIEKVLRSYGSEKFAIILDSDIRFKNSDYLRNIIDLINENDINNIACIGEIYQEAPFSIPLNSKFSHNFYSYLLKSNNFSKLQIFSKILRELFISNKRKNQIHKLPRMLTAALCINRDIYLNKELSFKYSYLEVIDILKNSKIKHRIMGDAGSNFLFQIAYHGLKIINIDHNEYFEHLKKGSRNKSTHRQEWKWLDLEMTDDPSGNANWYL